ncbi:hypothetical protein PM082_021987 [Marasmius tenuissimus]|nr:hypothetical protein PM082_021987 [Marasmius tenuissimus]
MAHTKLLGEHWKQENLPVVRIGVATMSDFRVNAVNSVRKRGPKRGSTSLVAPGYITPLDFDGSEWDFSVSGTDFLPNAV